MLCLGCPLYAKVLRMVLIDMKTPTPEDPEKNQWDDGEWWHKHSMNTTLFLELHEGLRGLKIPVLCPDCESSPCFFGMQDRRRLMATADRLARCELAMSSM